MMAKLLKRTRREFDRSRIRKKVIYDTCNKHIYDMSIKKELIFNTALKIMNHERIRPNYIQ